MEVKKKRGSNYTAAEKDILLEIIKKYENIIENKEINAQMIQKKRNAWNSVCKEFNAVAVSGFRTWQQLRHLYDNLKQRSKKNIGRENKEINRTGGGYYKSTPTKQDAQICKLVAQQVLPLSNPYDDAALYVGAECNGGAAPYAVISNTNHNDKQPATRADPTVAVKSEPITRRLQGVRHPQLKAIYQLLLQVGK